MYYEFYYKYRNAVTTYLVDADSQEEARDEFLDKVYADSKDSKYRYSGESYESLRDYFNRYPQKNCYLVSNGDVAPVGAPSYKESRGIKMSKNLRGAILEAVSDFRKYIVYYKRKGTEPKNLSTKVIPAISEDAARDIFYASFMNGKNAVEIVNIYKIDESKKINEAEQSFTVEYREDGKTKYSSVKANSESEALNKFRDITKDRNVSGEKIAATDVSEEGTLTEATDSRDLEAQCIADLRDILDGREFFTRLPDVDEYLEERGYSALESNGEYIVIEDEEGNQYTLNVDGYSEEGRAFTISFRSVDFINESKKLKESMSDKEVLDLYARRDAIYDEMSKIFSDSLSGLGDGKDLRMRWDKLQNDLGYIDQSIKNAVKEKLGDFDMLSGNERDLFKDSKKINEADDWWPADNRIGESIAIISRLVSVLKQDSMNRNLAGVVEELKAIKDYADAALGYIGNAKRESKKINEAEIIDLHSMSREDFDNLPYGRSFMSNRASISVDGKEYVKLSPEEWQYIPTVTHALGWKVSADKMWDIIQKGKSAQMIESKDPLKESIKGIFKK